LWLYLPRRLYIRTIADEKEGTLGPLRRIMEKVADLNEAAARAEDEPEEAGLRAEGFGPGTEQGKGRPVVARRTLMLSREPPLVVGPISWSGRPRRPIEPVNRR
jgi:hypothetical protein